MAPGTTSRRRAALPCLAAPGSRRYRTNWPPSGASWPALGSDGAWTGLLAAKGVAIAPLKPANCGFLIRAELDGRRLIIDVDPLSPDGWRQPPFYPTIKECPTPWKAVPPGPPPAPPSQ